MSVTDEDFIYFHTSFTQTSSKLVVEVVIEKRIDNHLIEKASGGLESTSIHSKGTIAVSIEPSR